MVGVKVTIEGAKELIAKLESLRAELENFEAALSKIGTQLTSYFENQVFSSQGGAIGTPWAKLAPSTLAQKSKHYRAYSAVPLVATGTMQHSFTHQAGPKHLIISNTAPYFIYHQSSAPRHKLPRRQMMGINSTLMDMIKIAVHEDINSKIGRL